MKRRDILKSAAMLASVTLSGRVYATPASSARLLVVFLRGAYDALNIMVPTSSPFYYQARPTLAISRPNAKDPNAALQLDTDWGLHPALRDTVLPLWLAREISFVPFVGTADLTRSHFETQATIEMGLPLSAKRNYGSGFLNRLSAKLNGNRSIAFTEDLPLIFRVPGAIPNFQIGAVRPTAPVEAHQAKLIEEMYDGDTVDSAQLRASVERGLEINETIYDAFHNDADLQQRTATSAKGFELAAPRIGRLMRDKFNLAFVDVGGWDTHIKQGAASGYLAGRIAELARGLVEFKREIDSEWANTVVLVISEFGRTFHENGAEGTDHGHGSTYWVMGGSVYGGRVAGPQIELKMAALNDGRDLPVLTDYRSFLAGIFSRLYGLRPEALEAIFPGVRSTDLGLV